MALAGALLLKGELAAARVEAEKAYEADPDSFVYLEWIGWLLATGRRLGARHRPGPALDGPQSRTTSRWRCTRCGRTTCGAGEFEEAYQVALLYRDATFFWRALMRATCLGHLGRVAEAKHEVAELLQKKPDFASRGRTLIGRHIKFPELLERIVDGLDKAGLALD